MDEVLPMRPAGFWIRAVALAIDVVVCALVQMSFGVLGRVLMGSAGDDSSADSTAFLFTARLAAAYWTTLHMVAGQTLGKAVVGIRVVGTDGALLDLWPGLPALPGLGPVGGHPRVRLLDGGVAARQACAARPHRGQPRRAAATVAPRPMVRRVVRPAPPLTVEPAPVPVEPHSTRVEPPPPAAAP